jgi:hypothetical protein
MSRIDDVWRTVDWKESATVGVCDWAGACGRKVRLWLSGIFARVCGRYLSMTKYECRGDSAPGAVSAVAGVTVSQIDAVRLPTSSSYRELHVTYKRSRWCCLDSNTLDCVDCGGCLHDVSYRPIMMEPARHGSLHRFSEVNMITLECVLI